MRPIDARWFYDNHVINNTYQCSANPDASSTTTTSLWANALFYYFLFGSAGYHRRTTGREECHAGLELHLFRKDYTVDDTYVFFGAQPYLTGGTTPTRSARSHCESSDLS